MLQKRVRLFRRLCDDPVRHSGEYILQITNWARLGTAAVLSLALASCTTTQEAFRQNPKEVPKVDICRTLIQTQDPVFARELVTELVRRGVNPYECPSMVQKQDQAAAALVAVAVVGGAVAYCANNRCGGGYAASPYPGNCQYNWQRDAAGNRCGYRSAQSRPGGW